MKSENNKIRLFILESNFYIRSGCIYLLAEYPQVEIVAESGTLDSFLLLVEQCKPDVILLDVSIIDPTNFKDLITNVLNILPFCKILAFAENAEETTEELYMRQGVFGLFEKDQCASLLIKAIETVHAHEFWFGRLITQKLWHKQRNSQSTSENRVDSKKKVWSLTDRECDVACLAAKGLPARKIGEMLFISEKTVRNQLTAIYQKLGLNGQIELCMKAEQLNFCRRPHSPANRDSCPGKCSKEVTEE